MYEGGGRKEVEGTVKGSAAAWEMVLWHYAGQQAEETTERKSVGSLRCTRLYSWDGYTGTRTKLNAK